MISMKTLDPQFSYVFADDCFIYRRITTLQDAEHLQEDLKILSECTKLWQMKINVDKCAVLRCIYSLPDPYTTYVIALYPAGHEIAIKECHIYLDVEIDNNMVIPYTDN